MTGFIVFIIVVVVIIFVVRQNKRKKAIEELMHSPGYHDALEIKEELSKKGYKVGDLSTEFHEGKPVGGFALSSGEGEYIGQIYFSNYLYALEYGLSYYHSNLNASSIGYKNGFGIGYENSPEWTGYCYIIENAASGLLVYSREKSKEPPLFLEIAADVIKRSGVEFKHPDWIKEFNGAEEYLNVRFQ